MTARTLFTFRLVPAIAAMCAPRGIELAALVDKHRLPREALRGEITAPLDRIVALLDDVAETLGLPMFGLELAAALPGGAYGTAEFLVRSAPTIAVGLAVLCEFAPLVNPGGRFRIVGPNLHYSFGSAPDTLGTHLNEFTIAYVIRQTGAMLGQPLPLARAWFSHRAPAKRADELARRLGCPVELGAADCGIALAPATLALAPRTADPLLFDFLHAQAKAQLAHVGPVDIITQLARVLETRLPHGELGADAVARAMATTARSLQRHLAEAGTTYRDVLAHVRNRRRAELAGGGVDDATIAKQLGFSDVRAMRRSLDQP